LYIKKLLNPATVAPIRFPQVAHPEGSFQ